MTPIILFPLLWILSFGVLLYFLRPTGTETAIQRHLANLEKDQAVNADSSTILKEERLSPIPWLHDLMKQVPGTLALLLLIKQAGRTWRVSSLVLFSMLAGPVAGLLASFYISITALSACIGIAVGLSPFVYLYFLREARFGSCNDLLPEAVDLMSRALRAGHAVTSVLEMAGRELPEPLASEFRTVYEEHGLGLPLREAILNLVHRVPRDDMRFLATAILLQKETGGNLANILDKTAAVMRERVRMRGQVRIYTAQGRITGWIMCCIPFVLLALISSVNPEYEKILFSDPLGVDMIYAGLIMMVFGILIIRKVIDIKV